MVHLASGEDAHVCSHDGLNDFQLSRGESGPAGAGGRFCGAKPGPAATTVEERVLQTQPDLYEPAVELRWARGIEPVQGGYDHRFLKSRQGQRGIEPGQALRRRDVASRLRPRHAGPG